jgi:hypothetical protein
VARVSNLDVLLAGLGSVGAIGGSYAAILGYLDTRGDRRMSRRKEAIAQAVAEQLKPITDAQTHMDGTLATLSGDFRRMAGSVDKNSTAFAALSDRITVLETKMEVFWRNVGVELARVLHSPNPAREHVDKLLEEYMDGHLAGDRRQELAGILQYIRDWHQGDPSDFPIYAGDQVAAAILLQTMGFASAGKT